MKHYLSITDRSIIPIILILIFFIFGELSPQTDLIDSLKNEILSAEDELEHINLLENIAYAYIRVDNDSAIVYADMILDLIDDMDNDTIRARVYFDKGRALYFDREFRQSIPYIRQSMELNFSIGDTDKYIKMQRIIGDAYKYMGIPDSAMIWYNTALNNAEKWEIRKHVALTHNDIALYYNGQGSYIDAITHYNLALKSKGIEANSAMTGRLHNNIGGAYLNLSQYENALDHFQKAYNINMAVENFRSATLNLANIGLIYYVREKYKDALEKQRQAYALAEQVDYIHGKAWSKLNSGKAFIKMGQSDSAVIHLKESRNYYAEYNTPSGVGLAEMSLGICFRNIGQPDSARLYFDSAIKQFEEYANSYNITVLLTEKANLEYLEGNGAAMESLLRQSTRLAKENSYLDQLVKNYDLYVMYNEDKGDYKKALEYKTLGQSYKDSIASDDIKKNLQAAQLKFETDRIMQENTLLKKDAQINELKLSRTKNQRTFLLSIFIAAAVIMLLLANRIINQRRFNEKLQTRNDEISKINSELNEALKSVKELKGLLPICANCKKIRDDSGYWNEVENYIGTHTDVSFSHGICPNCIDELYPEVAGDLKKHEEKQDPDTK